MSFWSEATEPLRKNRWTITFDTNNTNSLSNVTYLLKKCDQPSYKTTDIQHKFGNYTFNYPGRVEWNTINMTFASTPELSKLFDNILKSPGVNIRPPLAQEVALAGPNKLSFANAVGSIQLKHLDANGNEIEHWELKYPFFTNIKFGDLSYDSEEIVDIECTVRYDTATLIAGTGIAASNET